MKKLLVIGYIFLLSLHGMPSGGTHNTALARVTQSADGRFHCPHRACNKSYKTLRNLKSHYDPTHLGKRHQCPHCPYKGTTPSSLHMHIRRIHLRNTMQNCTVPGCPFSTAYSNEMNKHMERDHAQESYPCQAPHCEHVSPSKALNRAHQIQEHHRIFHYCPSCDYSSRRAHRVQDHIADKHNNNKFHCDECNKPFPSQENLARHKQTCHNEDRPEISCRVPLCGATFLTREGLSAHKLAIHKKVVASCPCCHKTFNNNSNLFRHLLNQHGYSRKSPIGQQAKTIWAQAVAQAQHNH